MALSYKDILSLDDINYLTHLPEVVTAKATIDAKSSGSVSFTAALTPTIRNALFTGLGLDLSALDAVPMRWIKGDTAAHADRGAGAFEKTYLVYVTDSQGELLIDGQSYPIERSSAYIFPEGLRHETVNTGSEPRLLIGPMSETGFAVGASVTLSANGATDTIYIKQEEGLLYFNINSGSWILINGAPINIQNTNPSGPTNILKVIFTTDITVNDNYTYFACASEGIQFGSQSLEANGSRRIITIAVDNYDGFIENGTASTPGYTYIYVYNLFIEASGRTPQIGAGWLGKQGFGNSSYANFIVNCSSSGDLPGGAIGSGGIVGAYAGIGTIGGSELILYGCSSSGSIGQLDGGIVGAYAGQNGGTVRCIQCFATGTIGGFGGGIFGDYAGINNNAFAVAIKCYTTGSIGTNAGGIFGRYAGNTGGQANAQECYSQGAIAADGGGIFGLGAASSGATFAINCYSSGTITTVGNGIYGTGETAGAQTVNCYSANGSWNTSAANASLQGFPSGATVVGTTWIATTPNNPYELNAIGYTPYSLQVINTNNPLDISLIQTYSQTIEVGQSTITAINADASGNAFAILKINDSDPNLYTGLITISQQTGAISTTADTEPGTYAITIRSIGSYNITTFTLTVTASTIVITTSGEVIQVPCCALPSNVTGDDYDIQVDTLAGNAIIANFPARRGPILYSALLKMKIANASKRR